ncbi:MAG: polyamine aminopropyltransferase [Spirochaetes bacterium]|nr:polyamine aminopropyltransferase [Spirochaetota bacterium]
MDNWAVEKHDSFMYGFNVKEVLYEKKSRIQEIKVVATERYGNILFLDNCVMLSEKWEFIYHEMIAHPVLFTHPSPKKVLIIGGGDGGTLREVLKHPNIRSVDMVEIDEDVVNVCKEYFPAVSKQINHSKANILIEDGIKFVANKKNEYDIILIDSSDPVGPAEGLFNSTFYKNAMESLRDDGILVAQSESPFFEMSYFKNAVNNIKKAFPISMTYTAFIPDYPFGLWSFTMGSKLYDPLHNFNKDNFEKYKLATKYYNQNIHFAAFSLPNFIKDVIK